jgi:hypothetical protein
MAPFQNLVQGLGFYGLGLLSIAIYMDQKISVYMHIKMHPANWMFKDMSHTNLHYIEY